MDPASMTFTFFTGQTKVSPFYTHRTDASVELICLSKLSAKVIEGGVLKNGGDAPDTLLDNRVTNIRVPAGHWLVLSRDVAETELEFRLRRIHDGSSVLQSPTQLVTNEAFSIAGQDKLGLVRNGLARPMVYRLIVRADQFDQNSTFYVQSGTHAIYPVSGSFVLDTAIGIEGALEIRSLGENSSGHHDLFVDP